jgi:hypothetical protein
MSAARTREEARRELAAVEEVLATRGRLAASAARIVAPAYVVAELGERPADRAEAKAWDRGLSGIKTYRRADGVTHQGSAFGPEPSGGAAKARQRRATQQAERVRRQLRTPALGRSEPAREARRALDIGR